MVIQKMSELVTSDSPIDDLDDESSEGQQGPLSSISENPASPMTSLGNEAEEEEREISEALDADTKNANYVNVEIQRTQELDSENNVPVSIYNNCLPEFCPFNYQYVNCLSIVNVHFTEISTLQVMGASKTIKYLFAK